VTAETVAHLREIWEGPLIVKGVMRAEECELILELGADAIVVSNHGARQLDGVPATIEGCPRSSRPFAAASRCSSTEASVVARTS
jgi:isopentenyl diphosphate isomerase/L-lactate dehydrogenase-like FMN-dependent dehydrogenase